MIKYFSFVCFICFVLEVCLAERCQKGWIPHGRSCYYFSKSKVNWKKAKTWCNNNNGFLARSQSSVENKFIVVQCAIYGGSAYWLGGTDLHKERDWVWESTGEKIRFSDWNRYQPDNGSGTEHCLHLNKAMKYKWNDDQCYNYAYFICEKPKVNCRACNN